MAAKVLAIIEGNTFPFKSFLSKECRAEYDAAGKRWVVNVSVSSGPYKKIVTGLKKAKALGLTVNVLDNSCTNYGEDNTIEV